MKWIKLLIIVISLSLPIHSYACWDDDMDDDDDSGWYDDNDNGDDWWNEDNYDDDYAWDIDLPDVIITPDDDDSWDESDDDWWRTDDADDDDSWDGGNDDWWDDDSWNDDSGMSSNKNNEIKGNDDKKNNYSLKESDKLSVNLKILNKQIGFKQGTNNTCVCSGLEFVAKVLGNNQLTESKVLEKLVTTQGLGALLGQFQNVQTLADDLARIAKDAGFRSTSYISDIKTAIDNGELVMTTIPVASGGNHDVIIVGYNSEGYIAYNTDRQQGGNYTIIPEKEINGIYKVGIKKK